MKIKVSLVFISCLATGAASAQGESIKFSTDEECAALFTEVKNYSTAHEFSELQKTSSTGIGLSLLRYTTKRDSIFLDLKEQYGETALSRALDDVRDRLDTGQIQYWSAYVDYNENLLSKRKKAVYSNNSELAAKAQKLSFCNAAGVYRDEDIDIKTYKSITKIRHMDGRFGHFDISVKSCKIGAAVGVKNKYSEPSKWEGSQFVVLDARFRNMDKEGRLPFEGSLIIKTPNGDELRYDNTETIMQEGYGIYFKSVNPLVTMPTKIVYRIPTDIEGEILWEPGRNLDGKRLWCTFASAEK